MVSKRHLPITIGLPMQTLRIGAHRGAMCHAPENTLAAFEKAIAFDTYRIEFDVRRSRDCEIVVMHDTTVDRTTDGTGKVADLTLEGLRQLKVGGSEPIPTFRETLNCIRGRSLLLVELKDSDITDQVVDLIKAADMIDVCTLSSFDEDCLRRAKEICPELSRAAFFVKPGTLDVQDKINNLGIDMLIVWPQTATPDHIAQARQNGLQVRCGYPDNMSYEESYDLFKRLADAGVDEYSCGRPDWIGRMIEAYERKID